MVRNPSLEGSCSNHLPQSPCTLLSSSVFKAVRFSASFREHLQAKVSFNPRETPFDYHHENEQSWLSWFVVVVFAGGRKNDIYFSPRASRDELRCTIAKLELNVPTGWKGFAKLARKRLLCFEEDACVDTASSGTFGPPVERAFFFLAKPTKSHITVT